MFPGGCFPQITLMRPTSAGYQCDLPSRGADELNALERHLFGAGRHSWCDKLACRPSQWWSEPLEIPTTGAQSCRRTFPRRSQEVSLCICAGDTAAHPLPWAFALGLLVLGSLLHTIHTGSTRLPQSFFNSGRYSQTKSEGDSDDGVGPSFWDPLFDWAPRRRGSESERGSRKRGVDHAKSSGSSARDVPACSWIG